MQKELTVTYRAPKGDSKVVEMLGYVFMDGKPEKIVVSDDRVKKLQGNPLFECGEARDHKDDDHPKETHKGR